MTAPTVRKIFLLHFTIQYKAICILKLLIRMQRASLILVPQRSQYNRECDTRAGSLYSAIRMRSLSLGKHPVIIVCAPELRR